MAYYRLYAIGYDLHLSLHITHIQAGVYY